MSNWYKYRRSSVLQMCCINKKITCQIHVQFSAQCSHKLYFLYNSSLLFLFCANYTWVQNICPGLPVCSIKCLFLEGKNNRGSLKMSLCFKFGRISLLASKWQVHKVVIDRTFGSAELFGWTSTMRFGQTVRPNRTFGRSLPYGLAILMPVKISDQT